MGGVWNQVATLNVSAEVQPAPGQSWPRFIVAAVAVLYLAGVAIGWVTNGVDGYYGITGVTSSRGEPNRLAITEIAVGSPADRAGLRPGDIVVAVGGVRLGEGATARSRSAPAGTSPTFQNRPLSLPPGDVPGFRRATIETRAGAPSTIQVERPVPAPSGPVDTAILDAGLTLGSRLDAPGTVMALLTWHIVALFMLGIGVLVVLRRPAAAASRLLLSMVTCFATALLLLSWDNRPLPDAVALVLIQATVLLLVLGAASLLHLCLIFPAPRPILGRLESLGRLPFAAFQWTKVALYLLPAALALSLFLGPAVLWPWSYLVVIALTGLALLALVQSMLHPPSPVARAQLKWIAGPLVVGLVTLVLGPGVSAITGARSEFLASTVAVAAWGLFPLGVGIAIMRYRLFDIHLVFRAAMLYPLLAAVLAGIYLASATAAGRVAVTFLGVGAADNPIVSVLAAFVVAAGAQPVYGRLQAGLDGLLYRERLARQRLMGEATVLLGQALPDSVATFLIGHVVNRLDLVGAWLVLPNDVTSSDGFLPGDLRRQAESLLARMSDAVRPVFLADEKDLASGEANGSYAGDSALRSWYEAGARLVLPLRSMPEPGDVAGQGLLGLWLVGPRRSGSLMDSEDVKALAQIARQASVLLDYDRLHWRQAADIKRTARFRRYFSPQIADLIASEGGELASHRRELTVLFAELRGFSVGGQDVEPEDVVGQLNECLSVMTEVIFGHGGTLDKYLGDGLMAFFGDPLPQPDHAARAVQASLAMQRRLDELRRGRAARGTPFTMGIGLATGWVTAGTIGSLARQEYTVVGDAVSVASRLASAAGPGEVLLGEKTKAMIGADIVLAPRGEVLVEGRRMPVLVFGVCPENSGVGGALVAPVPRLDRVTGTGRMELVTDAQVGPELLAGTPLFASLPPEELQRLSSHLRLQRFKKGATIVQAHDPCHNFFVIRSGTVKVNRALVTGEEAVINILGRGEFFGELALLEDQASGSTVVALQPTEVLVLSRDVFLGSLQAYPSAAGAAISFLSERIRRLSEQLEDAYSLELPQRLARRLLALGNTHGRQTDEGLVIDLPLTQSDLAALVGASRQRVNRLLGQWQDRRLLQVGSSGKLTLLQPETFTGLSPESLDS